jgi:hypothetical protein
LLFGALLLGLVLAALWRRRAKRTAQAPNGQAPRALAGALGKGRGEAGDKLIGAVAAGGFMNPMISKKGGARKGQAMSPPSVVPVPGSVVDRDDGDAFGAANPLFVSAQGGATAELAESSSAVSGGVKSAGTKVTGSASSIAALAALAAHRSSGSAAGTAPTASTAVPTVSKAINRRRSVLLSTKAPATAASESKSDGAAVISAMAELGGDEVDILPSAAVALAPGRTSPKANISGTAGQGDVAFSAGSGKVSASGSLAAAAAAKRLAARVKRSGDGDPSHMDPLATGMRTKYATMGFNPLRPRNRAEFDPHVLAAARDVEPLALVTAAVAAAGHQDDRATADEETTITAAPDSRSSGATPPA